MYRRIFLDLQCWLSLLTKKRFPFTLVENINSAITMGIHFIELTFVVSGTFKMIARCFCAFSGVDIRLCQKCKALFIPEETSNSLRAQIEAKQHFDPYNLKMFYLH